MRIGEFNQLLNNATSDTGELNTSGTAKYGGQAYRIDGIGVKATFALELAEMNIIDPLEDPAKTILLNNKDSETVELTAEDHQQVVAVFSKINSELPNIRKMAQAFSDTQDEQAINIKLPTNIKTFDDLSTINKRLDKLFKEFNIDGQAEFRGFDKGTDWYTVTLIGTGTYYAFLAGLKIAQEVMKLRTEYFGSEKAKVEYETAKEIFGQTVDKKSLPTLEEFQEKKIEKEIQSRVNEASREIEKKGAKDDIELSGQLVKATTDLVEALGDGIEFHLSLNPPEYATETAGMLAIDYKKMRELAPPKEDVKQIASGGKKPKE